MLRPSRHRSAPGPVCTTPVPTAFVVPAVVAVALLAAACASPLPRQPAHRLVPVAQPGSVPRGQAGRGPGAPAGRAATRSSPAAAAAAAAVAPPTTTTTTTAAASMGSTPVSPALAAAVLVAWRAALDAFDTAARSADWDSPALRATHVQPQLLAATDSLLAERMSGETSVGLTWVVRAAVERVHGPQAWVLACVDDGQIDVVAATGRPVPGPLGQAGLEIVRSL